MVFVVKVSQRMDGKGGGDNGKEKVGGEKGLISPPTHSTVTGKSLEAVEGNETH